VRQMKKERKKEGEEGKAECTFRKTTNMGWMS
jgi:hypothetical protein